MKTWSPDAPGRMDISYGSSPVCPATSDAEDTIQNFLKKFNIPGIAGVDTRALTKILREKGTMNGMITTNENYSLDEIIPKHESLHHRKSCRRKLPARRNM